MEHGDQTGTRERRYRVGAFAELTGVSIRTLHHYDHIGLLRPSGRTEAGYRLYTGRDLLCLQQILTLRYLGFELKQIRDLLRRADFDLVASLRIQRVALRDRIAELERIESALGALLDHRLASGRWAWELVTRASVAVQAGLQHRGERMSEYYTPDEMQRRFAALGQQVPAEEIRRIEEDWAALLGDVRANRGLDPASPAARELADRWNALTESTMQWYRGDPKLVATMRRNYEQDAYRDVPQAPTREDFAFIARVNQARDASG